MYVVVRLQYNAIQIFKVLNGIVIIYSKVCCNCSRLTAMRDGTGIQKECESWLPLAKRWLIALRDE